QSARSSSLEPIHMIASAHANAAHLTLLQAIVLGIVQGLTEFAPVSSSGHLILVPWLGGWAILHDEQLNKTFDVAVHIGTFLGAIGYFRHDIVRYVGAWVRSIRTRTADTLDERLAWYIIIGTIPGALAGALFEDVIEEKLGQPWLIAAMLAIFAIVLLIVDRRGPPAPGPPRLPRCRPGPHALPPAAPPPPPG